MENIETMPMTAGPGVFGLHENANIACALAETFVIFDTILLMEVGKLLPDAKMNTWASSLVQHSNHTRTTQIVIFPNQFCAELMLV